MWAGNGSDTELNIINSNVRMHENEINISSRPL